MAMRSWLPSIGNKALVYALFKELTGLVSYFFPKTINFLTLDPTLFEYAMRRFQANFWDRKIAKRTKKKVVMK
jgi:hypothetical protein